jgi:hypothetical protein
MFTCTTIHYNVIIFGTFLNIMVSQYKSKNVLTYDFLTIEISVNNITHLSLNLSILVLY